MTPSIGTIARLLVFVGLQPAKFGSKNIKREDNFMASRSSHPALSHSDSFASSSADLMQLVGRILIGYMFLTSGWSKVTNVAGATAYFTGLGVPNPGMMAYPVGSMELIVGFALILGLATRYAAMVGFVFVLVATAIAHRYWAYPAPAQGGQFVHFIKNLAILGGALFVYVFGAGRFSVDAKLAKNR